MKQVATNNNYCIKLELLKIKNTNMKNSVYFIILRVQLTINVIIC